MSDTIVSRGLSVLRDEGPVEFLRTGKDYAAVKADEARYLYWRANGERPLEIGPYTVQISISNPDDFRELRFFEENEVEELADLLGELSEDDVFLDVGANIGIYSLFADEIADEVYAVEPHPVNSSYLLINVGRNDADVQSYECALSDSAQYLGMAGPKGGLRTDGRASLSRNGSADDAGADGAGADADASASEENKVRVRTERGDDFIDEEGLSTPTVVKIDVEGAEEGVIDGLEETLADPDCRLVYCEVHEHRADYDAVVEMLESAGFDIDVIDVREYGKTVKATK